MEGKYKSRNEGVARNSSNYVFVVANYYFWGNIDGYFRINVLPVKIKK